MAAVETFGKTSVDRTGSSGDSDNSPGHEKVGLDGAKEDEDVINPDLEMSPEEYKAILRKLDWAIIPYVTLLYLLR